MFEILAEMVDTGGRFRPEGNPKRLFQKDLENRAGEGELDSAKAPKAKLHAKETPFLCDMWSEISKDLREIF